MNAFEITFWLSLALVGYSYVGYPVLLWVLSFFRAYDVVRGDSTPSVTYIVTAYNEERRIAEKLDNTLALTYPLRYLRSLWRQTVPRTTRMRLFHRMRAGGSG